MSHRRSSSSSRHHHRHPQSLPGPSPYILDFSAQTCRPRSITSVEEIRSELATSNRPGWQRVLVLRSLEGDVGGVIGKVGTQGWKWTFLDMQRTGVDGGLEETFCHAELWIRAEVYVLLLDGLPTYTLPCPRHPPHRRRSSSKTPRLNDFAYATPQKSVLEEKLWETLGDCRPLEEVVALVVYSSWRSIIQALGPATQNGQSLWRYLQALELNMDASATASVRITQAQWASLLNRLHQRIHLSLLLQGSSTESHRDNSSQSLDRIAYLGGLLLPLTVVSGILSIEGTYGPEGSAFWVFWLAAGLSSLVALLVIHADHLRTLDVWMEEEIFEPHGHAGRAGKTNIEDVETGFGVQATEGGGKRKKWRREELGWGGAVKKMTGWYRWKGSPGMEWRMPDGWEERVNRRLGW